MLLRPIWTSARCARRVVPRVPLPDEIVERVLLSPDLVPHILGPLKAEDGAAAAVCSQWLAGWKETNEPRRRLREVPFDLPEELQTADDPLCSLHVAATPDGRLVASAFTENQLHILDRNMRVLQSVTDQLGSWSVAYRHPVAADDHSVYYVTGSHQPGSSVVMLRTSLDGTSAAEYGFHDGHDLLYAPVLAGGLLFCVMSTYLRYGGDGQIEIFALDAQTMQLRHRFGRGLLFCEFSNVDIGVPGDGGEIVWRRCFARSGVPLAVGGDELYASVAGQDCLQVFSLTGFTVAQRGASGESPVAFAVRRTASTSSPREMPMTMAAAQDRFLSCRSRATFCRSIRIGCGRDIFTRSFRSTASCWCTGGTMKLRVNSDDSLRRQRGVLGCSN